MATKTTTVVFKQYDTQSVADLSGVAAALIFEVYGTLFQKNYDFWSTPVVKGSPSTIWGSQILLPIFDSKNMASKEFSHFSGLCLSFLFVKSGGFGKNLQSLSAIGF